MKIKDQINNLDVFVKDYSSRINAFETKLIEGKNSASWFVTLNRIQIEFIYTKKDRVLYPVSTLFCKISLMKNDGFFYHIPEIIDFMGIDDFHCYYFPYIENAKRLKACFDCICEFIDNNIDSINRLSDESDKWFNKKLENAIKFYSIKEDAIPTDPVKRTAYYINLFNADDRVYVPRFSKGLAYRCFLDGEYDKAVAKYSKIKRLLPYEEKLESFMKTLKRPYEAIDPECNSRMAAKKYNPSLENFFSFLISMVAFMILTSIPFVIAALIMNAVLNSVTFYADTIPVTDAIMLGAIPGLFLGGLNMYKVQGFLFRKSKEAIEFDEILVPRSLALFVKILVGILICAAIAVFVVFFRPVISVYDTTFTYRDNFATKTYEINDVESIYHIDRWYDEDDQYYDRESFVLVLKDGTQIDTIHFNNNDIKRIENKLLPVFDKNVLYVDSNKDFNDIQSEQIQ